jgi:hypothetical protein
MNAAGLVLVWDMDSTLVGNYVDARSNDPVYFNDRALVILKQAAEARKSGKVAAIFLLTNNADDEFIKMVCRRLALQLNIPKVFDYIMSRYHPARTPMSADPPKRLQDVTFMMTQIKKSTTNLANRIFFFDDRPDHEIRQEIPQDHYVVITPAYKPNVKDATNFKSIRDAILVTAGGRRTTRNRRKRLWRRTMRGKAFRYY